MKQDIVTTIVILLNIQYTVLGQSATFTVCNAQQGSSCRLTCTVTPASAITFRLNGNPQGSCPFANDPSSCSSVSHSISQIGDNTYLDITSLDYSRDDGTWKCENAVQPKNTDLIVYSRMQDISLSFSKTGSISEGESINVTAEMKCQYTNTSFTKFSLHKKEKKQNIDQEIISTTAFTSYKSTTDGCQSHESNIVATFSVSSSQICGKVQMYSIFTHTYLGQKTGSLSTTDLTVPDYNWHILVGWIVGILIIPVAGLFCFMFDKFIVKKSHTITECSGDKQKKFKLAVGLTLGAGVLVSLIVCIIIATQVCFSTFSSALGVGIGVSFGIMFICCIIIVVIYCTYMKGNEEEIGSEETGDRRKPTTETSKDTRKSDDKPLKTVGVAKPIVQDRPGSQITSESDVQIRPKSHTSKVSHNSTYENEKSKALEDVPKTRPLPSPRKDDNEEKIIITKPSKLPPLDVENSTSSPKKKKKKKKSKENESENKEKVDSP